MVHDPLNSLSSEPASGPGQEGLQAQAEALADMLTTKPSPKQDAELPLWPGYFDLEKMILEDHARQSLLFGKFIEEQEKLYPILLLPLAADVELHARAREYLACCGEQEKIIYSLVDHYGKHHPNSGLEVSRMNDWAQVLFRSFVSLYCFDPRDFQEAIARVRERMEWEEREERRRRIEWSYRLRSSK